jgi:hypothetical protein
LVACANFTIDLVNTLVDMDGLAIESDSYFTPIRINTVCFAGITNIADCLTDYFFSVIADGFKYGWAGCFKLPGYQYELISQYGFARDSGFGVKGEKSIQDTVRDLVGHFVRMAFGNGFRGEKIIFALWAKTQLMSCVHCAISYLATLPLWRVSQAGSNPPGP